VDSRCCQRRTETIASGPGPSRPSARRSSGSAFHQHVRDQRREQFARAFVAHGRGRDPAAAHAHDGASEHVERPDRLREDHRRLVRARGPADDAGIVKETAQTGDVLQQAAAAGEHDVGLVDRAAHRADVGAWRRGHAQPRRGRRRVGAQHVDRAGRIARAQPADDDVEERLVAEVPEPVVAGDQEPRRRHRIRNRR
jgi:hypothetical protein